MKTVKYIAEGNCKVKVGGVEYSGKMVIPVGGEKGLSEDDIKRLLKDRYIRKLEFEEGGGSGGNGSDETGNHSAKSEGKPIEKMNKAELLEKAKELEIEVSDSMTVPELRQKITEGKKPLDRTALLEEAAALGLASQITEATTAEEIQKLITEAKG